MTAISKAHEITLAFATQLGRITVSNGFQTDIGLRVFRGRRKVDITELPCVVLIEGDNEVIKRRGPGAPEVIIRQEYAIEAHLQVSDPDHPNDAGHAAKADIKRGLFEPVWWRAAGLISARNGLSFEGDVILPREDGAAIVSTVVGVSFEYHEDVSAP